MKYRPLDQRALTLAEHRALALERPITDAPIGGSHGAIERRVRDAAASATFDEHDSFGIRQRSNPTHTDVHANERAARRRKYQRRTVDQPG